MNVGFIGLGLMGNPMARNVIKKGFTVWVYNRTPQKTHELAALGAHVARSPAELARSCNVVISMVTGPDEVKEVLLGPRGIVNGAHEGLIAIDMSTIGPQAARSIGNELAQHGIAFMDCPVTGSTYRAETGELTIFAGGSDDAFAKARNVLAAMGTDIHHTGPVGTGQAVKLVNNLLVASTLTALGEGVLLGDAEGLSRETLATALANTPVMSAFMKLKMHNFLKNEYPLAFSVGNMRKDLELAAGELAGKELRVFEQVLALYREATAAGMQGEDLSAVMNILEKRTR